MTKLDKLYETIRQQSNLNQNKKVFAVFDFDNTCIVNDIAEATLGYMARNNLFKCRNILPELADLNTEELSEKVFKHYYGLLGAKNIRGAYEFGAKTLENLKTSEIGNLVENVLNFEGTEITKDGLFDIEIAKGIQTRTAVIDLIKYLQDRKVIVWVVSASPAVLVAEALKHFAISTQLIGIRNVIEDGTIISELNYPMSVIEGKVDCIKLFIDPEVKPILGVGDNNNDLPMLEYSRIKVVVNRHNSLSEKAIQENWFMLEL